MLLSQAKIGLSGLLHGIRGHLSPEVYYVQIGDWYVFGSLKVLNR